MGVKEWRRTPKGYICNRYVGMRRRVSESTGPNAHLYFGKELLTKKEFYDFALNDDQFKSLWEDYKASGFKARRGPSINRIDSSKGYVLGNIEFVSFEENCRDGGTSQRINGTACRGEDKPQAKLSDDDVRMIREFRALGLPCKRIAKLFRVSHQNVDDICKRKAWRHVQ